MAQPADTVRRRRDGRDQGPHVRPVGTDGRREGPQYRHRPRDSRRAAARQTRGTGCPSCPGQQGFVLSWSPLWRPGAGAVDGSPGEVQGVSTTQFGEQNLLQPWPHIGLSPLGQPAPPGHTRAATELLRQVFPGDSGVPHEQDAKDQDSYAQARPLCRYSSTGMGSTPGLIRLVYRCPSRWSISC